MRGKFFRGYAKVFSIVFTGLLVVVLGLYGWSVVRQATEAVETDAVVVDRIEDPATLVVEYTTGDGLRVRTDFLEHGGSGPYEVGDPVRIRYLPGDPGIARQADEPLVSAALVGAGGFLLLVGAGLILWAWWWIPRSLSPDRRGASGGGPPR